MASLNDVSLRQLQYAVAVADTLGFHKAASRCHVSQPTLSAQVQKLEEILGVVLFERDSRRVLLTSAGEDVLPRARRVLAEVEDLLAAARHVAEPFTGTLRLGIIPTIAPYLLPLLLPAVKAKYPELSLVFREEKTEDVVRELESGAIDAGVVALEADLGEHAHVEIGKDRFVAALPKGHPLAKKKSLKLADLEGAEVLLLDEGHCFRTQALTLCAKAGARENAFRATSLSTLAQMVSSGVGITLLPAIAVAAESRRGELEIRPFADPAPGRTLALVFRQTSPLSAAFAELAKLFGKAGASC